MRIRRLRRPAAPDYETAADAVLRENGVHVRRWSADGEGYAYATAGTRVIDAPRPHTAAAFAVLCHEVAHHALGHTAHPELVDARQELEEEREAWEFTFACFARFGFAIPATVTRRVAESMAERLAAAIEEGLEPVPPRFHPFEPAARALPAGSPPLRYHEKRDVETREAGPAPHPPP